jgi:hypothetical protein
VENLFFAYHSAVATLHILSFFDNLNYDAIFITFLLLMLGDSDPNIRALYRMEVLRNAESKVRPLFRVTLDDGEQVLVMWWNEPVIWVHGHSNSFVTFDDACADLFAFVHMFILFVALTWISDDCV